MLAALPRLQVDITVPAGLAGEALLLGRLPVDRPPEEGLAAEAAAASVMDVPDGFVPAHQAARLAGLTGC